MSRDASSSNDADAQAVRDATMYNIFYNKIRMRLGKMLMDHGLLAPSQMTSNFRFTIKLPPADEVMVAHSGEDLGTYQLENIQLEYESIDNRDIADEVTTSYATGRSLLYDYTSLMKTSIRGKGATQVNENTNFPRKSTTAILILLTEKDRAHS